jgi:hypothetical protein
MSLVSGIAMLIGGEGDLRGSVTGLNWQEGAGGNVFEGFLPSGPNRCVAVLPSGGYEADAGLPYDRPSIQIIVRGDDDPVWALDTWQKVYSALVALRNVTLPDPDETYLVSCLPIQSGPVHIGKDDSGRFMYGLNLETEIRNPTEERPA